LTTEGEADTLSGDIDFPLCHSPTTNTREKRIMTDTAEETAATEAAPEKKAPSIKAARARAARAAKKEEEAKAVANLVILVKKAAATKKAATKKVAKVAAGVAVVEAKPQAIVDDLDFGSAADGEDLKPQPRRSKWIKLLDRLYEATVDGKVPRGEDESLQFIRLGSFTNINGGRTQARLLERKGLDATYEFKTVTKGSDGSELWGRVIEVDA